MQGEAELCIESSNGGVRNGTHSTAKERTYPTFSRNLNYWPYYFFRKCICIPILQSKTLFINHLRLGHGSCIRTWIWVVPTYIYLFIPLFDKWIYNLVRCIRECFELGVHSTHSQTQTSYLVGARCFTIVLIKVFFFRFKI